MKISASIRREKILGSNVATDMFQNYKTSFVWDVTHIPKFIGRDGENNEGRTNVWVHCSEETLTEKDSDLDDSTAIGVGATIRMVDDLAVPDWSFPVQIDTETRHYGITRESIEDWEEQAITASKGKVIPTVCIRKVRYTYPEWGLEQLKKVKRTMYIGNQESQHREWYGPSLIRIMGTKGMTYPVTIEEVGDIKLFCVVDDKRSNYAWVIPDREVLVCYTDVDSWVMVPAFLLCMTSADDWVNMLGDEERDNTCKSQVFLEDASGDDHGLIFPTLLEDGEEIDQRSTSPGQEWGAEKSVDAVGGVISVIFRE